MRVPHEDGTFSKTYFRNQWNASNMETKVVPSHSTSYALLSLSASSVIILSRRAKRPLCWNVWLLLPFRLSLSCPNSFQRSYPVYINVNWNFAVNLFRSLMGCFAINRGQVNSRSTHDIRKIFPKQLHGAESSLRSWQSLIFSWYSPSITKPKCSLSCSDVNRVESLLSQ